MGNLTNNYVFKALDAFPFQLEETMEALQYALSYDDKDTMALCLMGEVYGYILEDYEKAKTYFTEALAENINAVAVYPHFINILLWNEDVAEAEKLIDFALTVKGTDKAFLYLRKAVLFERLKKYKKALSTLKLAKEHCYNAVYLKYIKSEKERIKGKLPRKKKKKKKKEELKRKKCKKKKKK